MRTHPGMTTERARRTDRQDRKVCPTPTTQPSAPSFRSIPPPTSRSRISPMACSPPRTASPRASASRSATTCSISGSSSRIAGSMSVEPGVFAAPSLNPFMALGPKVWSQTRARISELLRARQSGAARQSRTAPARAGADGGRQTASADRGRRLHRFLFVEGARHQCRRHVPRQGQRVAAELAAYADRLQRPRLDRRCQRHQSAPAARAAEAADCGGAELRPVQAARFRARNGRRGRAAVARWARCSPRSRPKR